MIWQWAASVMCLSFVAYQVIDGAKPASLYKKTAWDDWQTLAGIVFTLSFPTAVIAFIWGK